MAPAYARLASTHTPRDPAGSGTAPGRGARASITLPRQRAAAGRGSASRFDRFGEVLAEEGVGVEADPRDRGAPGLEHAAAREAQRLVAESGGGEQGQDALTAPRLAVRARLGAAEEPAEEAEPVGRVAGGERLERGAT